MRRWLGKALFVAAGTLVCDQALQLALRDGYLLSRRIAPFDPPFFFPGQEAALERLRAAPGDPGPACGLDPELGWCPRPLEEQGEYRFDAAGARIGEQPLPEVKRAGVRRVVVLGDSFTFGYGNASAETWCSRADVAREDLELVNLGVAGYGLDQMLLRLERDGWALEPDEVWIAFVPGTAPRIENVYVPSLRHWSPSPAFKPRFALGPSDELVLVPNPASSCARALELLTDHQAFLAAVAAHDRWVARAPLAWAAAGSEPAHRSGFARVALTIAERGGRDPYPELEDPQSALHRLALALLLRVESACRERAIPCRLWILPDADGLEAARARGERPGTRLASSWSAAGSAAVDLSPAFDAAGGAANSELWLPNAHYSALGNALIADALLASLGGP